MPTAVTLQPVATSFTLKAHIHDVLRAAIVDMDIYAADADLRLDERQLAMQLGISRTPVREALTRLEAQGFVEIQPRKGVYVRRLSLPEILDMIILWAALESMAARLATQRSSDRELASLRALASRYSSDAARADIAEYSEANIEFHQRIFELSQSPRLKANADDLFLHTFAVRRRAMTESNRAERSVVDHMAIIEALEQRDENRAALLVREHTMKLHDHVESTWRKNSWA